MVRTCVCVCVCVCVLHIVGVRHTQTSTFDLPLELIARAAVPSKNAVHKITLDSSTPTVDLHELFKG
jgi:hypothetical protein